MLDLWQGGFYKYQQSRTYWAVRGVLFFVWMLWGLIVAPLVLHVNARALLFSMWISFLGILVLSQVADYMFYRASKTSKSNQTARHSSDT
jgi:putative flippase GtrA